MENASKAFIIAGIVLISIILISIGINLWRQYSSFTESNDKRMSNQQLREFNVKFSKYEFNQKEQNYITAQDVRTITNLANDFNQKNGIDENDIIIDVVDKHDNSFLNKTDSDWVYFITNNYSTPFKCKIITSSSNGTEYNDVIRKIVIE